MAKRKHRHPLGGLFTQAERRAKGAEKVTALDRLNQSIDWEAFRPVLEQNLDYKHTPGTNPPQGGRPPYDIVLMFKILILQKAHALSDDETEHQILDRTSFQRFLQLEHEGRIPDAKTIWKFRERLGADGLAALFSAFHGLLHEHGLLLKTGKIIDASFVDVPRQHHTRAENESLKAGQTPSHWSAQPSLERQKDPDARHTQKNGEHHYGYKNHLKVDAATKLIEGYSVTPASEHDSQALSTLLDERDTGITLYADSAYRSEAIEAALSELGIESQIHERAYRNTPLRKRQQQHNRRKSRIRARIEHIFGHQSWSYRAHLIRTIGKVRATLQIGLGNLLYNFSRFSYLGHRMR
jgi:transposase, IS5 family